MKRLEEYSDDELVTLSDDAIRDLIKIECAVDGIKINPCPEEPKKTAMVFATEKGFEISKLGLISKTRELAEEFVTLINRHQNDLYEEEYDYDGAGYEYKFLKETVLPSEVKEKTFYLAHEVRNKSKELQLFQKLKAEFDKDFRAWKGGQHCYLEVQDRVWSKIHSAQKSVGLREKKKADYIEYLRLSNGDPTIAGNFFAKVYPGEEIPK